MIHPGRIRLIVILTLVVLAALPGISGEAPVRRALLIGINDYLVNDLPAEKTADLDWVPGDLNGAVNDVEMIRSVLISRFGFKAENVETLTDKEATRAAMLQAMERLAQNSRPQDIVYIHFSGHGSRIDDSSGDEEDSVDETILPHDARTGSVPDITDDELGAILDRLKAKSVFIALDSCHSGTATRGASVLRTRAVPPDNRARLYGGGEEVGPRGAAADTTSHILMTGAASYQPALDGPVDGVYYGFFSYALARSMASAPANATAEQIHAGVRRVFQQLGAQFSMVSMPDPQLELPAALAGRPVLRSADAPAVVAEPRLPWVEVIAGQGGRATLASGKLLGAVTGSLWAVYPPGEIEFEPGKALAIATVTEIVANDAVARLEPASAAPPAGSRAVALAVPPLSGKIPVQLDRIEPEMRARLMSALRERSPDIEIVGPGEFARFVIDVEDDLCRVYDAGGREEITSFKLKDESSAAGRLAELASRSLTVNDLLALDNPASKMRLDVQVLPADQFGGSRAVKVVGSDVPAYKIRRPQEARSRANSLMLQIKANQNSYLTVVDVDTEGGVNLLFPNAYSQRNGFYRDGYVAGGKAVLIPDSLQKGNRAGFYWDYAPPSGIDTVKVFASTDLETARMIREHISRAAATAVRGGAMTRGGAAPGGKTPFAALARRLAAKAQQQSPRPQEAPLAKTVTPIETPGPDWTSASITFLVQD